ncbi:MAG: hypothetical protein KatS3mg027_1342 [Bacteroidia bacterium]|nr:MAG: hypothetical protein KatS3mg027_1342 [Bacteroidia bacterium]
MVENTSILFASTDYKAPRTKIAIDTLYTDIGQQLCQKIAEKYKVSQLTLSEPPPGKLNFQSKSAKNYLDHQILIDTQKLGGKILSTKRTKTFSNSSSIIKFPKEIGESYYRAKSYLSLWKFSVQYEKQLNFSYRLQLHYHLR